MGVLSQFADELIEEAGQCGYEHHPAHLLGRDTSPPTSHRPTGVSVKWTVNKQTVTTVAVATLGPWGDDGRNEWCG